MYNNNTGEPIPWSDNITESANCNQTNCSNSQWTDSSDTQEGWTPRWALVALVLIPLWILCGNMLVLLAVMLQPSLRSLSNCVIASLAVTDFLLALLVVPLGTYQLVGNFLVCTTNKTTLLSYIRNF